MQHITNNKTALLIEVTTGRKKSDIIAKKI